MNESNVYLNQILQKYKARDYLSNQNAIVLLQMAVVDWASSYYIEIFNSGSRAKDTAISLTSDFDYLISLTSNCEENTGGLEKIYYSLYNKLKSSYPNVRKQNVSVRVNMNGLNIDVTPARKHEGNTNDHSLYLSKFNTWKKTNIQQHICDIKQSGRTNEIKLLKIWRELNQLDFPSIYLEYLIVDNILKYKLKDADGLADNFFLILTELAKDSDNPLSARIVDPANSKNILSDLLNDNEKRNVIVQAKISSQQRNWNQIVY